MAYNTGNPVGSNDFKDLSDNAVNFDKYSVGADPTYPNRLGVLKLSIEGMNQEFNNAQDGRQAMFETQLAAMGYTWLGDYGSGLSFTSRNQYMVRDGLAYTVANSTTLPYTSTGNWATEVSKFKAISVDDILRADLASPSAGKGAALIGSTRADNSVTTVEDRLDEQEAAQAAQPKILDTVSEIQAAFPDGGTLRIANNTYDIPLPLVIDYGTNTSTGVATSFPGYVSKRYSIRGESWANTILVGTGSDYVIKAVSPVPLTQSVIGLDSIEDLTITNPVRNLPNTSNTGSSGILCQAKALTNIKRVHLHNLKVGLKLDAVLTSAIEEVNATGCYNGIISNNDAGASGPNSMLWSKVRVSDCVDSGIISDIGAASHFDTITVEGNGTFNTNSCGMLLTCPANQLAGVITITNAYFELNKGIADLYINNASTYPVTVIVEGSTFTRAGTAYVTSNIRVESTGGGQVNVILRGCHFLSVSGYTPSSLRPFWSVGSAVCHVNADEYCTFNETTSLVGSRRYAHTTGLITGSDGIILGGDSTTVSCTRLSAGSYQYTSTGFFGLTGLDYSVCANPCDSTLTGFSSGQSIRVQPVSASSFVLNCFVGTTATDMPHSVHIVSMKAGV